MTTSTSTKPARKTLGTAYNLRPSTEVVPASVLRVGDVVLESDEHPARITNARRRCGELHFLARYIWQADTERAWLMGIFRPDHPFDRAKRGEYT